MEPRPKTSFRGTYRNHDSLFGDDRKGLGYGQVYPTGFHDQKPSTDTFPYTAPDPYEDVEGEEWDEGELDGFVAKINSDYSGVDSLSYGKTDPFYKVAGNTTGLGGVSESSMVVAKNSIVPMPGWSKKAGPVSGGFSTDPSYTVGSAKKTGTLQGYFNRPPTPDVPMPDDVGAYTLWDVLSDDEMAMAKIDKTRKKIDKMAKAADDDPRMKLGGQESV